MVWCRSFLPQFFRLNALTCFAARLPRLKSPGPANYYYRVVDLSGKLYLYAAYFLLLLMVFAVADTQGSAGAGEFVSVLARMLFFLVELVFVVLSLSVALILAALAFGPVGILILAVAFMAIVGWRESFNFVVFSLIFLGLLLFLF